MSSRRVRLGSRGSLLALAQSRLVCRRLRALNPGLTPEIVTLQTRGDRDRVTPLDRVGRADFFSDELDQALLDRRIDFTVHSMKDLATERPAGIHRAAIPVRENPRDVIIFRGDVLERLRTGMPLRIGSSSQRRRANVKSFLERALPQIGPPPQLRFEPLRGPVDHRVARLADDPSGPQALDGVILALAGLARLWNDPDSRQSLRPNLDRVRWMVLPLSECPAAPAQGALALECNADDTATRKILAELHDPATASLVKKELQASAELSVPERSGFGATAIDHATLGPVLFQRGRQQQSNSILWNQPARPATAVGWDSSRWFSGRDRQRIDHHFDFAADPAVFVAHWSAATDSLKPATNARIWVSGTGSWQRLAERGIWVEGCAENLGFTHIVPTLSCAVLGLPPLAGWTVLTRRGAEPSWRDSGVGRIIATYTLDQPTRNELRQMRAEIQGATDFFWGSAEQYLALSASLPDSARHACGAGKTAEALIEAGIHAPLVFPSRKEWQSWLR